MTNSTDNLSTTYDVIVSGAGPAGSIAAAVLSRAGVRTLLLDRAQFPRDKVCGDGVPLLTLKVFEGIGLPPETMNEFFRVGQVASRKDNFTEVVKGLEDEFAESVFPTSMIAPRYKFDNLLFQHAVACGATFQVLNVTGPVIENGQVVGVQGTQDGNEVTYRAKAVIAADGATSAIARGLSNEQSGVHKKTTAVSIRGYVKTNVDLEHRIEVDFLEEIGAGYAWFFPVGPRYANIGLGIRADYYDRQSYSVKDLLEIYRCKPQIQNRIGSNPIENIGTWQIPLFSPTTKRVFNGAILVGDAGDFVNPITGDGIYEAISTGKFAAETIIDALQSGEITEEKLEAFNQRWLTDFGDRMKRANMINQLLTFVPRLTASLFFD